MTAKETSQGDLPRWIASSAAQRTKTRRATMVRSKKARKNHS